MANTNYIEKNYVEKNNKTKKIEKECEKMNNRSGYTLNDIRRNTFYQTPRFLFDSEFENLSHTAKLLYTLLCERHELSFKNHWVNDDGYVYLIFSRENMCSMLKISKPTVTKAMKELKEYNLVNEKRLGLGKANQIYLLMVDTALTYEKKSENVENTKKLKDLSYSSKELLSTEVNGSDSSNTNIIKTNNNSESKSESESGQVPDFKTDVTIDTINNSVVEEDSYAGNKKRPLSTETNSSQRSHLKNSPSSDDYYTTYKKIIQDNVEYNYFLNNQPTKIDMVNELVNCMLDVICTEGDTVRINGERKKRSMVISQYLKINSIDIEHILAQYNKLRHKITHIGAYLKTMLYTVKQENSHYYTNQVYVDGLAW